MSYIIVSAPTHHLLAQKINEHLADNWALQGGMSVATDRVGNCVYFQAMVKA